MQLDYKLLHLTPPHLHTFYPTPPQPMLSTPIQIALCTPLHPMRCTLHPRPPLSLLEDIPVRQVSLHCTTKRCHQLKEAKQVALEVFELISKSLPLVCWRVGILHKVTSGMQALTSMQPHVFMCLHMERLTTSCLMTTCKRAATVEAVK